MSNKDPINDNPPSRVLGDDVDEQEINFCGSFVDVLGMPIWDIPEARRSTEMDRSAAHLLALAEALGMLHKSEHSTSEFPAFSARLRSADETENQDDSDQT